MIILFKYIKLCHSVLGVKLVYQLSYTRSNEQQLKAADWFLAIN